MSLKEHTFYYCAQMILNDQCPPEREHYLCMKQEDGDVECSCIECWNNYLWELQQRVFEVAEDATMLTGEVVSA